MYIASKPLKGQTVSLIQKTWNTPYLTIHADTYAIFQKKFAYPEVDHTDGIGTKGMYHWKHQTLHAAVLDALAMNLNDLAMVRAIPYKMQNQIKLPLEDARTIKILKYMVLECKKRKIVITGGETSFHSNTNEVDISMTVSGFIKKPAKNRCQAGDVVIGLPSNGLHSNGFTTIRALFGDEYRPAFTRPTKIYLDEILAACDRFSIHGMMHITGGAFTKLKDIAKDCDIHLGSTIKPQPIFFELYKRGLSDEATYQTFNCGVGFVLTTSTKDAPILANFLGGKIIGNVTAGSGTVRIDSAFSPRTITF